MDAEDEGRLKERDLKNHLEPEAIGDEETMERKKKKSIQQRTLELRHGPLTAEKLRADYQVKRALEILISYDIFKNLK
jgi:carboxyl-terminal processing protease